MIKQFRILALILFVAISASIIPISISSQADAPAQVVTISQAHAFHLGDTTVVTKTLAGKDPSSSPWVKSLFNTCRMLLDIVAFILLIIVAFMNILQKDMDNYAIKKMLPPAIYALILGNLGLPIFALISRFVDALMGIKMFSPLNLTQIYETIIGGNLNNSSLLIAVIAIIALLTLLNFCGCCFFFLLLGIPLLGVIILNLLLSLRPFVIYIGAAVSPLAFAANILPGTQEYFKKWLGIVLPWMIFPALVSFVFWLAKLIPSQTAVNVPLTWALVPKLISVALPIALKGALLYFAVRLPFTLEKDITALAATAGKATANWGWNQGRNLMGGQYRKFDNGEKTEIGNALKSKEHMDFATDRVDHGYTDAKGKVFGPAIKRSNYDPGAAGDAEYEDARKSAIEQEAKKHAKDTYRKKHAVALAALTYNPLNALDAYKESKEMRVNRGKTGAKKFSQVDQMVGGAEYMQKYKQEAAKDDLRSEQSAAAAMNYAPGSYKTIFSAVRKRADQEASKYTAADLPELDRSNPNMAAYVRGQQLHNDGDMEKAARRMALRQLRDMNIGGAGAPSYQDSFGLDDKSAGEMVEINNKFWQNVSRRFAKTDEQIFGDASKIAGGLPAALPSTTSSPVGDIGEITEAESIAGSAVLSNGISEAVENLGATVTNELPTSIAQAMQGLDIKASLPDVRATVDKFSMDALSNIQASGMNDKDAKLLIDGASMGNLGFVSSAIQAQQSNGSDTSTNPFFLAIRRAAGAGYLQRSTENNIIQEIAKSDDTNTTLMMAQKLAPAMSAQGGEGVINQHLKTLVDVSAGVQVKPEVKQDMERYFANLNLGVNIGGKLDLDPTRVQSALTALKSPEFQINPKVAIGKATLSNGYAQNAQDAIKAAMANKIPDDAIAYDQTVQIRLNETIKAEASVRGVDLSKVSMGAIEKAKTDIQSQIVGGGNAQMAVSQAFNVMVQAQPQIRQQAIQGQPTAGVQAPAQNATVIRPVVQAPPPSQPASAQAEEMRTTPPQAPPPPATTPPPEQPPIQ